MDKKGEKISVKKIEKTIPKNGLLEKRARLAETLAKFRHRK